MSPAYQFNLPDDTFGTNVEEHTWDVAAHLEWVGSSAAGYGRSKLGGYCNGEYAPF